jgi:hypothetical protein
MMNDGIVGEINLLYCGKYKMNITTDKVIIYGILFFFAIFLCQCGLERTQLSGVVEIGTYKEGMTSSVIAPTQTAAAPAPAPAQSTGAASSSKLSACGDACDTYSEIQKTLDTFNNIYKKQDDSTSAVHKVDSDIIKLAESVKNMGKQKTPGGNPKVTKDMIT